MVAEDIHEDMFRGMSGELPAPSQVRRVILTEHRHLRVMLKALEASAEAVLDDASSGHWLEMRVRARDLLSRMSKHIELENAILAPALRDNDPYYGPVRARNLIEEHAAQQGQLEASAMLLDDRCQSLETLARSLIELVATVRADMEEEERLLLNNDLLSDDIVTTDFYSG
jgi:hypothetical protein